MSRDIWFKLEKVLTPSVSLGFVANILDFGDVDGDGADEFIAADMKGLLMIWKDGVRYKTDCRNSCGRLNYSTWVAMKMMGKMRRQRQDVCVMRLDGVLQIWTCSTGGGGDGSVGMGPGRQEKKTGTAPMPMQMYLAWEKVLLGSSQQVLGLAALSEWWDAPDNYLVIPERNHITFFSCSMSTGANAGEEFSLRLEEETRKSVSAGVDGLKVLSSPRGKFLLLTQRAAVSVYRLEMASRKDVDWALVPVDSTRSPPLVDLSGYTGPVVLCTGPAHSTVFAMASLDGRLCVCKIENEFAGLTASSSGAGGGRGRWSWGVTMSLRTSDCLFDVRYMAPAPKTECAFNRNPAGHFIACAWTGRTYILNLEDFPESGTGGEEEGSTSRTDSLTGKPEGFGEVDYMFDTDYSHSNGHDHTDMGVGAEHQLATRSAGSSVYCFDSGLVAGGTAAVSSFCAGVKRGPQSTGEIPGWDGSCLYYSTAAGEVFCVNKVQSQLAGVASPCLERRVVPVEMMGALVRLLERGDEDRRLKLAEDALGLKAEALREGGTQFFLDALWALPERKILSLIDALVLGQTVS